MDREKVITEIEDALSGNLAKAGHVYGMSLNGLKDKALKDAIDLLNEDCHNCKLECLLQKYDELKEKYDALLKEQEHSETFIVIDTKTGKEADEYAIALYEDWAKHLCYCDMDGWAIMDDGSLLLVDECGKYACADRERFKVKWEC